MIEELIPKAIAKQEIIKAMSVVPDYDESVRKKDMSERLVSLSDIYKAYIASSMSEEIYIRFYTAIKMALKKKESIILAQQQKLNYTGMYNGEYRGVIGGANSFTVIGMSGLGKSSSIERAISVITDGKYIENTNPYYKIVPCIVVQCPFDCSAKGMLLEILRTVDCFLETRYYPSSQKNSVSTNVLIGTTSQVLINHVGLLIIDEIQNVVCHKNGMNLINMLTQLINCSGISICMVGTPECIPFFEGTLRLARRSLGLRFDAFAYDEYFKMFCTKLFNMQYVANKTTINESIIHWLYEHSKGILSVVVSLIHDAQELAIFSGKEILNLETLNEAYVKRMELIHSYTKPKKVTFAKEKSSKILLENKELDESVDYKSIPFIVQQAKDNGLEIQAELSKYFAVEEVKI